MVLDDSTIQRLNAIKLHSDPIAQAQLIGELRSEIAIRNKDISDYLEMQPSYLSHLIRIARLPELILDGYHAKHLSFTHLVLISRLKKYEDMVLLYEEVLKFSLTASQTEHRIRDILYHIDSSGKYLSNDRLTAIKNKIQSSLDEQNTKVSIIQTRIKAKIIVEVVGNLEITSEFIDNFGSRFRHKRTKSTLHEEDPIKPLLPQDITLASDDTPRGRASRYLSSRAESRDPSIPVSGGRDDDTNIAESTLKDNEAIADDKKFRFDPDF